MTPAPRRRNLLGHRRRVEDEGDDDGRPDGLDLDDDSLTDGTMATDDHDAAADSDTSNIEDASPTSGPVQHVSNGSTKPQRKHHSKPAIPPAPVATRPAAIAKPPADDQTPPQQTQAQSNQVVPSPPKSPSAPVIVSSASAMRPPVSDPNARRRNENDDYKRRRDQDPAFVPNRGAFFMHRQAPGPPDAAFRPFGRGTRGRGGRASFAANSYGRIHPMYQSADPTANMPWTHDMHEAISVPQYSRRSRQVSMEGGLAHGNGFIPTCRDSDKPINRTLSTEKHIGNVQVRVYLPNMEEPSIYSGIQMKQYTKLPDHRPPLRRDKPVRISLPEREPSYIYPASDRSFTFIPRALRPNQQQRVRGKPRSGFGSVGNFSRRTSAFGGSYYGSMYSASGNISRRSSIIHERDFMFSPTGSAVSRQPYALDRPIVRLPPCARMDMTPDIGTQFGPPMHMPMPLPVQEMPPPGRMDGSSMDAAGPALPMHQPRPQKNISVAHIESPGMPQGGQTFQQAFHQQVPVQIGSGYQQDSHSRRPSHSQRVSGTPLSHIPERPAHAAPFNTNAYPQQGYYHGQPQPNQQGYYYPGNYAAGSANGQASGYPSNAPSPMAGNYAMQGQMEPQASQTGGAAGSGNLVAQEANGMVYYFDPCTMQPPTTTYAPYPSMQTYPTSSMGMHGMMTPSPDTFYYSQTAPGMMYYPQ